MQVESEDNELMKAYILGDEASFRLLFTRYSSKLLAFIRYRLGRRKDYLADEIFQKTWLKVHASRKSFKFEFKFSTWVYTIALNTLRDEVGSASERLRAVELSHDVPSDEHSIEEQYIAKEQFHELKQFLSTLKENQRVALLFSDEDGMSGREIATVMGLSEASVRQLVSRARKEVRNYFKKKDDHE